MDSMATASIGLFQVRYAYFLQIITADLQNFYFAKITAGDAISFAHKERVKIEQIDELPEGIVFNG